MSVLAVALRYRNLLTVLRHVIWLKRHGKRGDVAIEPRYP